MKSKEIFASWAQNYIDSGYSVIPIDLKTKRPSIKDWQRFSKESVTDEQLDKWLKSVNKKNANIGLVCGKASGIVAIDFDYNLSDSEHVEGLVKGILPPIRVAKKGKTGWTAFFKYNPDIKSCRIDKKFEGKKTRMIDVLSDGCQTVIPPSIHPDTEKKYYWITPDNLDDLNASDLDEISADTIKALYELTMITKNEDYQSIGGGAAGRHDVVFGHAIRNISSYKSIEEMVSDMVAFDNRRHLHHPKGPYFKDENYLKGKDGIFFATALAERIVSYKKRKSRENGQVWELGSDAEFPSKLNGFFSVIEKTNRRTGEVTTQLIPEYYELSEFIKKRQHFIADDSNMYLYKSEHYNSVSKLMLRNEVIKLTKKQASVNQVNNFCETARSYCYQNISHEQLEGFLNLENGILNLKTGTLEPHTPKMFFKYKLPHAFSPGAKCEKWLEFLLRVFEGDQQLVDLSAEIFGYAMAGGNPWLHKAFLLYGEGRNGKSTFIDVLSYMLGAENISAIPIENLQKPFSVVMADGKLANIVGEMTSREIDSSAFKTAVGGEYLVAANKGMAEYKTKFYAKMFFACNQMPYFRDTTSGAHEKLCIIPFKHYFKPEDRIPLFAERFLYPEISGIINWAIQGYQRLKSRSKLPVVDSINEMVEDYRAESNTVLGWFRESMVIDLTSQKWITMSEFYGHYQEWCEAQNMRPVGGVAFARRANVLCQEAMRKNVKIEKYSKRKKWHFRHLNFQRPHQTPHPFSAMSRY